MDTKLKDLTNINSGPGWDVTSSGSCGNLFYFLKFQERKSKDLTNIRSGWGWQKKWRVREFSRRLFLKSERSGSLFFFVSSGSLLVYCNQLIIITNMMIDDNDNDKSERSRSLFSGLVWESTASCNRLTSMMIMIMLITTSMGNAPMK